MFSPRLSIQLGRFTGEGREMYSSLRGLIPRHWNNCLWHFGDGLNSTLVGCPQMVQFAVRVMYRTSTGSASLLASGIRRSDRRLWRGKTGHCRHPRSQRQPQNQPRKSRPRREMRLNTTNEAITDLQPAQRNEVSAFSAFRRFRECFPSVDVSNR